MQITKEQFQEINYMQIPREKFQEIADMVVSDHKMKEIKKLFDVGFNNLSNNKSNVGIDTVFTNTLDKEYNYDEIRELIRNFDYDNYLRRNGWPIDE